MNCKYCNEKLKYVDEIKSKKVLFYCKTCKKNFFINKRKKKANTAMLTYGLMATFIWFAVILFDSLLLFFIGFISILGVGSIHLHLAQISERLKK